MHIEASGGLLLLGATFMALLWANSPWSEGYYQFWDSHLSLGIGGRTYTMSLEHFVNDGLMAVFFFSVGLEIKREVLVGELSSVRKAAMPIAAAIGGMIVPAVIYVSMVTVRSGHGIHGWAIPTATDIAFAVGVMALLGKRVPLSLKVFVTALAIADDIGAVLVIAVFYTSEISVQALGLALALIGLSAGANRIGVRTPLVYALLGIAMWVMLLRSGIHATIGGVMLAFTIPVSMRIPGGAFVGYARGAVDKFDARGGGGGDILTDPERQDAVQGLVRACEAVQTPLNRLEHALQPWVAFGIMPVFALANAGISLGAGFGDSIGSGVGLGVGLGLLLGKPIGVIGTSLLAAKFGLGDLPAGVSRRQFVGAGFLAGIGFTMSMFVTNLAFRGEDSQAFIQLAKTGILCGSFVSALLGFLLLRGAPTPPPRR